MSDDNQDELTEAQERARADRDAEVTALFEKLVRDGHNRTEIGVSLVAIGGSIFTGAIGIEAAAGVWRRAEADIRRVTTATQMPGLTGAGRPQ